MMGSLLKKFQFWGAGQRKASFESLTGSGLDKNCKITLRSICFPTKFLSKNGSFAYFWLIAKKPIRTTISRFWVIFDPENCYTVLSVCCFNGAIPTSGAETLAERKVAAGMPPH